MESEVAKFVAILVLGVIHIIAVLMRGRMALANIHAANLDKLRAFWVCNGVACACCVALAVISDLPAALIWGFLLVFNIWVGLDHRKRVGELQRNKRLIESLEQRLSELSARASQRTAIDTTATEAATNESTPHALNPRREDPPHTP